MAIAPTVTRRDGGGWGFVWPVGTAPYSVYLDGVLLEDELDDEAFTFTGSGYDDEPPALEILNDGDDVEGLLYPPFVRLQWRGLQTAKAYLVEQYVSSAWTDRVTIGENASGYYAWSSRAQDDGDATQWRVSALDLYGNAGTPLSFSYTVVRNPAAPSIELAIDGGTGDLVVSEA